ncbi:zinc knuckle CX2CX4HX4C containing protein [Tanacetum coccineum]
MGLSDLEKGSPLLNNFATRFKSIDGKLIGKDGVNDQEDQVNIGDGNSDVGSVKACSYALVLNDKTNTPKVTFMYMNVDDVYLDTTAGNAGLGNVKLVSFSSMLKETTQKKRVHLSELHNDEIVTSADVSIPLASVEEIEGMEKVLEDRPWLIHLMPIILNVWTPNARPKKDKITKPIMLDAYTSNMCGMSWGRNTYARALIEVLFKKALVESLVVVISYPNGSGHSMETIKVEYEWQPLRCDTCNIFDHNDDRCPKKETSIPVRNGKNSPDLQDLKYVSLKNLFVALRNEDDIFDVNNVQRKKDDTFGSSNHDSDNEEVEEVFFEKAPPKKTPRKISPKRNVAFSPETKVHYFNRDDIEEVEHENANSKKG